MQCPKCRRENDPDHRFCIFCGCCLHLGTAYHLSAFKLSHTLADEGLHGTYKAWLLGVIRLQIGRPGRRRNEGNRNES
jgi:hypothetical protein